MCDAGAGGHIRAAAARGQAGRSFKAIWSSSMPIAKALRHIIGDGASESVPTTNLVDHSAQAFMRFMSLFLGLRAFSIRWIGVTVLANMAITVVGAGLGSLLWSSEAIWFAIFVWRPQTIVLWCVAYVFNVTALVISMTLLGRLPGRSASGKVFSLLLLALASLLLGMLAWIAMVSAEIPELTIVTFDPLGLDTAMLGYLLGYYISYFQMFSFVTLSFVAWLSELTGGWLLATEVSYGQAAIFLSANAVWLPTAIYVVFMAMIGVSRLLPAYGRSARAGGAVASPAEHQEDHKPSP